MNAFFHAQAFSCHVFFGVVRVDLKRGVESNWWKIGLPSLIVRPHNLFGFSPGGFGLFRIALIPRLQVWRSLLLPVSSLGPSCPRSYPGLFA